MILLALLRWSASLLFIELILCYLVHRSHWRKGLTSRISGAAQSTQSNHVKLGSRPPLHALVRSRPAVTYLIPASTFFVLGILIDYHPSSGNTLPSTRLYSSSSNQALASS